MPIEPFKIVNADGSVNQSEYDRCVEFLNSYVNGTIPVYPQLTWTNPFEVDLSQQKSAYTLIREIVEQENNRLLTRTSMDSIKKLFKGLVSRYGSTIHTYGRYLEESQNFTDGPGYMYDVLSKDETRVLKEEVSDRATVYYLDDDNHTVLEYNDVFYSSTNNTRIPVTNFPKDSVDSTQIQGNIENYPFVYKGNLCGIYSDFQRLSGQYVGSSTLFYYSECNDTLYTTGANSTQLQDIGVVNFNLGASVSNKSKPTRGIDLSKVSAAQDAVVDETEVNAYIPPETINTEVNYLSPLFFTARDTEDWKI